MPITTVFFDLGDTLWHLPNMPDRDVVRGETMRRVGGLVESWGYDMREGERRMLGRDIRLMVEEETRRAFHGDCVEPDYEGMCRRVAESHGIELSDGQAHDLWYTWNLGGLFLGRDLFPDVADTLRELRRRGYRLGSITNRGYAGPLFWEEVDHFGLREMFEVMAISCDVGYLKPHPRIYQYATEAMNVEPEECVMVGDNLRADVEGAKTVGMLAVWRPKTRREPIEATEDETEDEGPIAPDYKITQIAELLEIDVLRNTL
jgi:HAD superfamily hydrolase (TIGR01662 family)